ncbi:hypothetical protein ACJX0J_015859 [Zea mays]
MDNKQTNNITTKLAITAGQSLLKVQGLRVFTLFLLIEKVKLDSRLGGVPFKHIQWFATTSANTGLVKEGVVAKVQGLRIFTLFLLIEKGLVNDGVVAVDGVGQWQEGDINIEIEKVQGLRVFTLFLLIEKVKLDSQLGGVPHVAIATTRACEGGVVDKVQGLRVFTLFLLIEKVKLDSRLGGVPFKHTQWFATTSANTVLTQ